MITSNSFKNGGSQLHLAFTLNDIVKKIMEAVLVVGSDYLDKKVIEVCVQDGTETLATFSDFYDAEGNVVKVKGGDLALESIEILLYSEDYTGNIVLCPQVDSIYSKKYFTNAGLTEKGAIKLVQVLADVLKRNMEIDDNGKMIKINHCLDGKFIEMIKELKIS